MWAWPAGAQLASSSAPRVPSASSQEISCQSPLPLRTRLDARVLQPLGTVEHLQGGLALEAADALVERMQRVAFDLDGPPIHHAHIQAAAAGTGRRWS